jgi:hypothetical protein
MLMAEQYWASCRTFTGREHVVRAKIEELDRGAFLPTYVRSWVSGGKLSAAVNTGRSQPGPAPKSQSKFRKFSDGGSVLGKRGPKPKLAAIDRLEGNPSKRVIEESEIEALGEPFVPEHLSDDTRGCIEVIMQSMPSKIYSALDSFILAAFGTAWALHKMAAIKSMTQISSPFSRLAITAPRCKAHGWQS